MILQVHDELNFSVPEAEKEFVQQIVIEEMERAYRMHVPLRACLLYTSLCIANQTGVNVTEAFARNLEKKTKRDQARHINNPKLSDHGE